MNSCRSNYEDDREQIATIRPDDMETTHKTSNNEVQMKLNLGIVPATVAVYSALGVVSAEARLQPILKWAGGKERELAHITAEAPREFSNFYDPFVGGGSVFAAFDAKAYFINDKSTELIGLYNVIKQQDDETFAILQGINESWKSMRSFVKEHTELKSLYEIYRDGNISDEDLRKDIYKFLDDNILRLESVLGPLTKFNGDSYKHELQRTVFQKLLRMAKIEKEKGRMPDADIFDNIETAFMGSLYMFYRGLYNDSALMENGKLNVALFLFIRNYAYSGMFRYNSKGEFNVPYGGIGYNHKTLDKKLDYYRSKELLERMGRTTINCGDFEAFLKKNPPTENDFVFLDPPYDTEFSTYAQNEFDKNDQKRLAHYLIKECKGKWMLVIKNTPFIYSLYDGHGLTIMSFDKTYQVSFMNRNNRKVEHLLIKNY